MSDVAAAPGSTPTDPTGAAPAAQPATLLADPAAAPAAPAAEPAKEAPATEAPADEPAEKSEEKPAEKPVAPAEYEAFKLPEGYTMDEELGGDLKTFAKANNLTQEQAQALADLGAKQAQKFQATQADALAQARTTWEAEAKADKEYGGDKFGENLAVAQKAMAAYASPELKTLLNQTGLGSHPEFIRLMVKAGQAISEDRLDTGRQAPVASKSAADRLYGKPKQ